MARVGLAESGLRFDLLSRSIRVMEIDGCCLSVIFYSVAPFDHFVLPRFIGF
jgi:hypothetical protein